MSISTTCWSALHLEQLFNDCFHDTHHTILVGGASEPLYLPPTEQKPARIFYTRDYYRSALHEIAHWCVAGPARRQLEDYGYWYASDGRTPEQQRQFEQVEVHPQALELIFSAACGHEFRASADNLNGQSPNLLGFQQAVYDRALELLQNGLSKRARLWTENLASHYRGSPDFQREWIDQVYRPWLA